MARDDDGPLWGDAWRDSADADDPRVRRRARLQGLALMAISSAITVLALYGAWALVSG